MKQKSKSGKKGYKGLKIAGLYTGLFGVAIAAVYFGTPLFNGAYLSSDTIDDAGDDYTLSNVDRFMSNLTEMTGLDATIKKLQVSFPDNDGIDDTYNLISLKENSPLIVAMPDTDHIGFHLDTEVSLSTPNSLIDDVTKAIYANYDSQDLYVSLLGAKVKYLDEDYETVLTDLIDILGEDNIAIPDEFYDAIDGIVAAISGSSSEEGEGSSTSFDISFVETSAADSLVHEFTCEIAVEGLGDEPLSFKIGMTSDDSFNLTGVTIDEGDLSINGIDVTADIAITPNQTVTLTSLAPSDADQYVSVVNFRGLLKKTANLVKAEKLGINFDGALAHTIDNAGVAEEDDIVIDVDAAVDIGNSDYRVALDIGNGDASAASQNLQIAYLPETVELPKAAFLNYNDTLKLEMEQTTMDEMIARIEEATSESSASSVDLSEFESLFSFITESEVVKAIGEGHYQAVVNMVDDLKVEDDGTVIAGLDLSGLGLGEDAAITVTASSVSGEKLLTVDIAKVAISDFEFNGTLTLDEYFEFQFDRAGYNDLKKLPDIYDQTEALVNSKKFGLGIDADIAIGDGASINVAGGLQMNLNEGARVATASLTAGTEARKHLVKFDLDETAAKVQYQDAAKTDEKGTLAKINVSTITDIVDFVKEISGDVSLPVTSSDDVLSGLESVLGEVALTEAVGDIMDGRYSALTTLDILSSYTFTDTESVFSVNGEFFGLEENPVFKIQYTASEETTGEETVTKYVLSSAEISLKIADASTDIVISLVDYNDDKLTSISGDYADSDFCDFSHVNSLARAAYKTVTEMDSYHLKANAKVTLWTADIIDLDVEFAANKTDAGWEYYAKLSNIPLIPGVNSKYSIFLGYRRSVELVYKEETGLLYLSAENPFGKHGYSSDVADEDRNDDNKIDWTEKTAATYTTEYLSNNENLLKFILGDILNVQPYYLNQIAESDSAADTSSSSSGLPIDFEKLAYQNVLESTSYESTTGEYDMELDLAALFDDADYVAKAELGVKVNNDNYLSTFGLSAFVFAGVRVDFALTASLIDPGTTLSDDVSTAISNVITAAQAGTAYTAE